MCTYKRKRVHCKQAGTYERGNVKDLYLHPCKFSRIGKGLTQRCNSIIKIYKKFVKICNNLSIINYKYNNCLNSE